MANSVGIIDSGYMAKVRNISKDYYIKNKTRLFQICAPDLTPITEIVVVDELPTTTRGKRVFGSTGY